MKVTEGYNWGAVPENTGWKILARGGFTDEAIDALYLKFNLPRTEKNARVCKNIVEAYQSFTREIRDGAVIHLSDNTILRVTMVHSENEPQYVVTKETITEIAGFRAYSEVLQLVADLVRNDCQKQ